MAYETHRPQKTLGAAYNDFPTLTEAGSCINAGPGYRPGSRQLVLMETGGFCPNVCKALSTLATVTEFGDSRRIRWQSPKTATVAEFGDKLSPFSATIVASVDMA